MAHINSRQATKVEMLIIAQVIVESEAQRLLYHKPVRNENIYVGVNKHSLFFSSSLPRKLRSSNTTANRYELLEGTYYFSKCSYCGEPVRFLVEAAGYIYQRGIPSSPKLRQEQVLSVNYEQLVNLVSRLS